MEPDGKAVRHATRRECKVETLHSPTDAKTEPLRVSESYANHRPMAESFETGGETRVCTTANAEVAIDY